MPDQPELRQRITRALRQAGFYTRQADTAADVLLALPGIAIVQLPEPDSTRYECDEHEPEDRLAWVSGDWSASAWQYPEVQVSGRCRDGFWQTHEPISIADARRFAACLLAAAGVAEEQTNA